MTDPAIAANGLRKWQGPDPGRYLRGTGMDVSGPVSPAGRP